MAEPKPTNATEQRQIPRIVAALDDLFDEGRGVVIGASALGNGSIDITIGDETVTVDRKTFVRQSAVFE